jgi:hypothetical protein
MTDRDGKVKKPSIVKKAKKTDLKTSRRAGCYWVDSKPFLSVTNILSVLDKPSLRIWYGQCVYRALAAEPGLSEQEALKAPYMISGKAKNRGTSVHDLTEHFVDTDAYIESLSEEMRGYGIAYRNWVHDFQPKIIAQEQTVFSNKHGYAGTLDALIQFGEGEPIILDKKTGADLYPEVQLQLSAYKECYEEKGQHVGMAALLLKPDGTYKFERYNEFLINEFLACKRLYEWKNKKQMEEIQKFIDLKNKRASKS